MTAKIPAARGKTEQMLAAAKAVFRADLFDAALPDGAPDLAGEPADGIGAFAGPPFDVNDIGGYLRAWSAQPKG